MGWGGEKGGGGRERDRDRKRVRETEYVHGLYVHIIQKNIKHLSG
jgi:hypothetical protein